MKALKWIGIILVVLLIGGGIAWWKMGEGSYTPGALAARQDLTPQSTAPGPWKVAEGIEISHFSTGSGPNILTIHGGPGIPPATSAPAFDLLSDRYKIHYYAQRGTGDSTRPITEFSSDDNFAHIQSLTQTLGIGEQLADIERIRQILGDEKLIVVGHSYGGFLAALYAAEMPEKVEALILLAPANLLVFPSPYGDFFDEIENRLPADRKSDYQAWRDDYFDLMGAFSKSEAELQALDGALIDFWQEAVGPLPQSAQAQAGSSGPWMARAQFFSMGMRHDYSEALGNITAPVLLVHGAKDLQPVEVSELYGNAIAKSEVITIQGAGHFLQHSAPEALSNAIADFLARVL